jgi:Ran GTPase-activating protein (RanGAP) involved in mRNA processing and transport
MDNIFLAENILGHEGAKYIAEGLKANKNLKELNLGILHEFNI